MLRIPFRESVLLAAVGVAACAPGRAGVPPVPVVRPEAPVNPRLPAMPLGTGPLDIRVVYPRAGEVVASRDSAFIFGSVGNGNAFVTINGHPSPVWPNGAFMAFIPIPPADRPTYEIAAVVDGETARLSHPVQLLPPAEPLRATVQPADTTAPAPPPPGAFSVPRYGIVGGAAASTDTVRVIYGSPSPDSAMTRFFFLRGTVVRVADTTRATTVVVDDAQRVRLASARDVALQPESFVPPARAAGALRVQPADEWVDVVIPTGSPPPYLGTVDGNVIRITLYGTPSSEVGDTAATVSRTPAPDPLLSHIEEQHTTTRSIYAFALNRRVYGYQIRWQDSAFVVRIRRHPRVDATTPLRGLTIALDPGHPGLPGESPGATGPTGLREPDAVLAVALILRDYLQQRGASVFMTRSTPEAVPLNERQPMAVRANAHAFVSIHLNAVPDNVNPFRAQGTSTYYWHNNARRLAELTHEAMLRHMFLPDLGVRRDNFAVIRIPWMPAILTEGAFIMMPDQEYALRTIEYQAAYARSILEGLERYFGEVAVGW